MQPIVLERDVSGPVGSRSFRGVTDSVDGIGVELQPVASAADGRTVPASVVCYGDRVLLRADEVRDEQCRARVCAV
jgi:hypothetical protein